MNEGKWMSRVMRWQRNLLKLLGSQKEVKMGERHFESQSGGKRREELMSGVRLIFFF